MDKKSNPSGNNQNPKGKYVNLEDLSYSGSKERKPGGAVIDASDSFRDTQATISKKGRVWVYPQKPQGKRYDKRKLVSYFLLAIFFITPFIRINGNPHRGPAAVR